MRVWIEIVTTWGRERVPVEAEGQDALRELVRRHLPMVPGAEARAYRAHQRETETPIVQLQRESAGYRPVDAGQGDAAQCAH